MKKLSVFFIIFTFLIYPISNIEPVYADSSEPSRIINVVYDDSGSMIESQGKKVDRWCQAKYAMEVFGAMLGDNDAMNIYVMSDFYKGANGGIRLSLDGSSGSKKNVSKIHKMITDARGTPFGAVKAAYSDLKKSKADEKWLVILTDGEFEDIDDVDGYFENKDSDIKVMMFSMGETKQAITPDEYNGIYFEKADDSSEILNKLTNISARVFNSHKLKVNTEKKTFSFDVPMSQLVVFAQGKDVSIKEIQKGNNKIKPDEVVTVQFSEKAANNYDDVKVDKNLVGEVATFDGDFKPGKYEILVEDAETIEVYYKPNIDIKAYVTDSDGKEVTNLEDLEAGTYVINFGFVKKGTEKKVEESELLGNVEYKASVTNNGVTHDTTYDSGDKIRIEEGTLAINVVASFLDYNTVSTTLEYSIYKDKTLKFKVVEQPTYIVDSKGIKNGDEPIVIKASIDGNDYSEEQWSNMDVPTVSVIEEHEYELGKFKVEKAEEVGYFNAYPTLVNNKPSRGTYTDTAVNIKYDGTAGKEAWKGKSESTVKMTDERGWLERNLNKVIKGLVLLALLLLLLGYVPPFKKRLPKRLKRRPVINGTPTKLGVRPTTDYGSFNKKKSTTFIPYKAETGTIRFVPRGVSGVPALRVKAAGGNRMIITNTSAFEGKDAIEFDGLSVPTGTKKNITKSAGVTIKVTTKGMSYTCSLNQ